MQLGGFSKDRRRRQRELLQTNDLMTGTVVLHRCVMNLGTFLWHPLHIMQPGETTKLNLFWRTQTTMTFFAGHV